MNNNHNQTNGVVHKSNENSHTLVNGDITTCYFNKQEMVRLLIQSLQSLGYKNSADSLEKESGYSLQSKEITQFSNCILNGEWSKIDSLLPFLNLRSKEDLDSVKFLIYSQKYIELVENKNIKDALVCLRSEITPLSRDSHRLQSLTSLIMCPNAQQLESKKKEICANSKTRTDLLNNIRKYVSSDILLPENRLEHLIKESIQYQIGNCLYHNTSESYISLFKDHQCSKDQMPIEVKFTMKKHKDEVWFIKFSNDGKRLASCGKENIIIIWDMSGIYNEDGLGEPIPMVTLHGHSKDISYLSWSPDDRYLLSASSDNLVKLWNMNGFCLKTFSKHTDNVTACAWHPDGKRFITGSNDKHVYLWNIGINEQDSNNNSSNNSNNGNINGNNHNIPIKEWLVARVNDLSFHRDGKHFVVICQEKKIRIYDLEDSENSNPITIPETDAITSMQLSKDSRNALISINSNQEIHLWDFEKKLIVQKYRGQKQGRFVIRPCFGGIDESFVLSGSEDSLIYIWHRQSGALLETLSGHFGTVNCVCWSPISPHIFCSASDDHTIKVWTRPLDNLATNNLNLNLNNNNTTPTKKRVHD